MPFLNFGRDNEPKRSFWNDLETVGGFISDQATKKFGEFTEDLGVLSSAAIFGAEKTVEEIGERYNKAVEPIQIAVGQEINKFVEDEALWRDVTLATEKLPAFEPVSRIGASFGAGAIGSTAAIGRGFEWQGVDQLKPLNDKLDAWVAAETPEDQGFIEKFYSGLGSASIFYAPGLGIMYGAGVIGAVSPILGAVFAGSTSAAFESLAEAGSAWQESKNMGKNEAVANERAEKVFWANLALISVTNTVGMFNPATNGLIKKMFMSSSMEGLQEFGQQIIQNVTAEDGRDPFEGALEAGVLGFFVGGLLGMNDMGGTKSDPRIRDAVNNNINSARQISETVNKKNMPGVLENAKENIRLQLDYDGYTNEASKIEKLNISKFKTVEDLEVGVEKTLGKDGLPPLVGKGAMESIESIVNKTKSMFKMNTAQAESFTHFIQEKITNESVQPKNIIHREVDSVVEKAEEEMGRVPSSITDVERQILRTVAAPAEDIQRAARDIYMDREAVDTFVSVAPEGIEAPVQLRTDDFAFKTFRSENEVVAYLKKQKAKTLEEAIAKEGKFEGYALQYKEEARYKVTDREKLARVIEDRDFITTKEAIAKVREFPFIEKVGVVLQANKALRTIKGERVWGSYKGAMIKFLENPHKTTVPHEAVHAFLDLMVTPKEKQEILNEVKRRYAGKNYTDAQAEERLAQDFAEYYTTAKAPSSKLGKFFNWLKTKFNELFSKENVDIIDKFYREIQAVPARKKARKAIKKIRAIDELQDLREEYAQTPKALTTKLFKNVDIANREFLPVQWLKDFVKSKAANIRPVEQELILDVLATQQFEGQKKIKREDFEESVASELLPLDIIETDTYASYGSENVDMSDFDSKTYLFNSPFEHGQPGHFHGDFELKISENDLDIVQIPTRTDFAVIRKGVKLTEENVEGNTFTVTKTKEEAQNWIDKHTEYKTDEEEIGMVGVVRSGLFSSVRAFEREDTLELGAKISYIAEIQSDPFQGGKILKQAKYSKYAKINYEKDIEKSKNLQKDYEEKVKSNKDDLKKVTGQSDINYLKTRIEDDEYHINREKEIQESVRASIKNVDKLGKENPELKKLEEQYFQYRNEWHVRSIKEIIRVKAMEGFETLRFPTGFTVSNIEGYISKSGEDARPYDIANAEDPDQLKAGDEINYGGENMTVVEEDNYSIQVAPSDKVNTFLVSEAIDDDVVNKLEETMSELRTVGVFGDIINSNKAQKILDDVALATEYLKFSNIDEEIKRFEDKKKKDNFLDEYDKKSLKEAIELKEKKPPKPKNYKKTIEHFKYGLEYETEKIIEKMADGTYGEEFILDNIESEIEDTIRESVSEDYSLEEIYGDDKVFYEDVGRDDQRAYIVDDDAIVETFSQPCEYEEEEGADLAETFDPEEHLSSSDQRTVATFYEKRIYKELMKLRNKEVERVEDDNGFTWYEIKLNPKDREAVEVFQTEEQFSGKKKTEYYTEDLLEMSDFTDYVAGDFTVLDSAKYETDIRRLAEFYGIDPNLSNKRLRNSFTKILEENYDRISTKPVIFTIKPLTAEVSQKMDAQKALREAEIVEPTDVISEEAIKYQKPIINKKYTPTTDYDINDPDSYKHKLARFESELLAEAAQIEKGGRIFTGYGVDAEVKGYKSTFAQWIPESLRQKKIIVPTLEAFFSGNLPKKYDEIRLYNYIVGMIDQYDQALQKKDESTFGDPAYYGDLNSVEEATKRIDYLNAKLQIASEEILDEDVETIERGELGLPIPRTIDEIIEAATIAERKQTIKQTINEAIGAINPKNITTNEKKLLNFRLRAMARGVKMGRRDMREILNKTFKVRIENLVEKQKGKILDIRAKAKAKKKSEETVRDALINYAEDLPKVAKGELLRRISRAKTEKNLENVKNDIDGLYRKYNRKEQLEDLKKIVKKTKRAIKGSTVDVEYQKQVIDILETYNLKTPTEATQRRLKDLKKLLDKTGKEIKPVLVQEGETVRWEDQEVPYIPEHVKSKVDLFASIPIKDMTAEQINDLNDLLLNLLTIGKIKREMELTNNAELRAAAMEKLIINSVNMDPKIGKPGSKTYNALFDKKTSELNFLHTFRVFDKIDGSRSYKGMNVKMQRALAERTTNADIEATSVLDNVFKEIKNIKNDWTEEEQATMMLYMLIDMEANTQAQTLINHMGWTGIPVLTTEELMAMDIMRNSFNNRVDALATVYEELSNKVFARVENYFPLKYQYRTTAAQEPTIGEKQFRPSTKTKQGFTFGRKRKVKKVPRIDVFAMLEEATREQIYYKEVQPALSEIYSLVSKDQYAEAAGEIGQKYWLEVLDAVAHRGQQSMVRPSRWLRTRRVNLTRAILGYKISTVAMQPMAIFDATAFVYMKYGEIAAARLLGEFAYSWIKPGYAKKAIAKSRSLQIRRGGQIEFDEIAGNGGKGLIGTYQRNALKLVQKTDLITAASVDRAAYKILKSKGLSEEESQADADMVMQIVSGSSDVSDRPLILTKGEGWRSIMLFQTFFMNRWGLISHDIITTGIIKGKLPIKFRAVMALAILGLGGGVEDELRRMLLNLISGKDRKEKYGFLANMLWSFPEAIPVLGNLIKARREFNTGASIPLTRMAENMVIGSQNILSGEGAKIKKGSLQLSEATAAYFGFAGAAQIGDIAERFLIKKKKEVEYPSTYVPSYNDIVIPAPQIIDLPQLY